MRVKEVLVPKADVLLLDGSTPIVVTSVLQPNKASPHIVNTRALQHKNFSGQLLW